MPAVMEHNVPQAPVLVASARRKRSARDVHLVLSAAGVRFLQREQEGTTLFFVEPENAERAQAELQAFQDENRGWPRVDELPQVLTKGWLGVVLWAAVLILAGELARHAAGGWNWFQLGRSAAGQVREGEWWRTVTALTLHGDLAHLTGNLVFGALFVGLACQVLGTGTALMATLGAGALGNWINAWVQGPEHASIGASTAVFGALGILVGDRLRQRPRTARGRALRWVPLLAGAFLLGFLGMGDGGARAVEGGARIDVLAHGFGFLTGLTLAAARPRNWRPGPTQQTALGITAGVILVASWWLALA